MNKIVLIALMSCGITISLFGCPCCIDRINELQEPFFLKKAVEVVHE